MTWYAHVLEAFQARPVPTRPLTWQARCPTHDDRKPTLRIWLGNRGRLLVRCWTRVCETKEVLASVGLTMSDLFEPEPDGPYGRYRPRKAEAPRRVVATYDYQDADGRLLYQSVRYEPKSFNQRRPDGHGGWLWNLDGVGLVPFRLPQLLARPTSPVVVVEGEKDVLNLEQLGLLATCNVGGTGMGWRPEYSRWLARRRVVVIPDNDVSGHRHADLVLGSLVRHGALSVRLATLPGDVNDVSDWLARGHGRDDLVDLIRKSPEYSALLPHLN